MVRRNAEAPGMNGGPTIRLWLKAIGLVVVLVAIAIELGNFEAAGVALLLLGFARHRDRTINKRLKLGVLSIWFSAFVVASVVAFLAGGLPTRTLELGSRV
jgi:hypothetical protein